MLLINLLCQLCSLCLPPSSNISFPSSTSHILLLSWLGPICWLCSAYCLLSLPWTPPDASLHICSKNSSPSPHHGAVMFSVYTKVTDGFLLPINIYYLSPLLCFCFVYLTNYLLNDISIWKGTATTAFFKHYFFKGVKSLSLTTGPSLRQQL